MLLILPVVPANTATIAIGDVVQSRVTADDPLCDPNWPHRCRYYRLTAPADGVLAVTIRWSTQQLEPYPLDVDVVSAAGRIGSETALGSGHQRRTVVRVRAGEAYAIEVWSFVSPGEAFELSSVLHSS